MEICGRSDEVEEIKRECAEQYQRELREEQERDV
jgi:hypothetical protein